MPLHSVIILVGNFNNIKIFSYTKGLCVLGLYATIFNEYYIQTIERYVQTFHISST